MKLLLTSAGITNETIAEAFVKLVGKHVHDIRVAFIPTAANVEEGNKTEWFFRQYEDLRNIGVNWIDMVDFADTDVDWRGRLDAVDVLYLTGGNTFYLLDQIRRQGFDEYLREALKTKVYVGGSASAITMTPSIDVANIPPADPNTPGLTDFTGLSFVDFELSPHTPDLLSYEQNEAYAKTTPRKIYAYDDKSAVQVVGGEVTVISEGEWKVYNA